MGTRPEGSPGALARCRLLPLAFVFLLCAGLLMAMVATDVADMATGSPARYSGGGRSGRTAGADAFRSSKRRIPKGPDPIHNRACRKDDDRAAERLAGV
ncbi:hypothetical protein ACP70R_039661 [Stipagrostis hirtigluma subsp. patula]